MTPSHRPAEVERIVRAAPAHSLPESLEAAIVARVPGVLAVRLLLADYHLSVLLPSDGGRETAPVPMHGTAAGQAFVSRRTVLDPAGPAGGTAAHEVFTPVTARGERLGVLGVLTTAAPQDGLVAELAEIAEIAGAALKVAWNHTDRYERARRRRRLTLAAEMQWQLLPGQGSTGAEYSLGGHLEPAYSIAGDNFDWSAEQDHLALSVTNGSGTGMQAALLTSLIVGALRNARRSGADVAEQASLAGDMVNARYHGEEFTETLVLRVDLADGLVSAVDAGSPRILRMRGATVTPIVLEHQLPLGMFAGTAYEVQQFGLEPGDRLVLASDGVYAAVSPSGDDFGTTMLERQIRLTRLQDTAEVPLSVIASLMDYHDGHELNDDAVVLCLDWK